MKSVSSITGLLRRSLLLLAVLTAVFLISGALFTKASYAQRPGPTNPQSWTNGGYVDARVEPNGGPGSFIAIANGDVSWNYPMSYAEEQYIWIYLDLDGVRVATLPVHVSKDALSPSDFAFTYPFTFGSGTHHVHFYSGFDFYQGSPYGPNHPIAGSISNPYQFVWNFDYDVVVP